MEGNMIRGIRSEKEENETVYSSDAGSDNKINNIEFFWNDELPKDTDKPNSAHEND